MAPAKMLLLPTLLVSLLPLMVPSHCKEDPTTATPAISQASSTICGITTAGSLQYRRIQCPKLPNSADSTAVVPSLRNILAGVCVPDGTFCSSGVYSVSGYLCGGSTVIYKKSDDGTPVSCQFCLVIKESLQDLSQTIWQTLQKVWMEFNYPILATVFVILFVACCLIFRYILARVFRIVQNFLYPNIAAPPIFPAMENVQEFSFNEIKTITNNFSKRIGSGGFGKVFWGRLSNNGRQVAVKRGNTRLGSGLEKAFKTEVETLSKARHENVVDLIGYCTQNNGERILVYEFLSNRDLYAHIHPRFWEMKSMLFYSWKQRVNVLLDVAKGIEYLHKNAEPPIIQRDIKSANILIDENWVAKISDFGISVFGPEQGKDYVELEVPSGTAGYLEPDVNANNLRAIPANDVFSFGVVMLEVLTGRKAIKDLPVVMLEVATCRGENWELAYFAPRWIRSGNLKYVLDKRLAEPVGPELEAVTTVARLAQQCVMVYHQRPGISTIVTELQDVLALFNTSEPSTSKASTSEASTS